MEMIQKRQFSSSEVASALGISRIAVHKKIKSGLLKAHKVGRNYIIEIEDLSKILNTEVSDQQKTEIQNAVKRAVKEHRSVFERLAKE
jgi:excisionase family DNA binding protein